jgi:hypothetical protein
MVLRIARAPTSKQRVRSNWRERRINLDPEDAIRAIAVETRQ